MNTVYTINDEIKLVAENEITEAFNLAKENGLRDGISKSLWLANINKVMASRKEVRNWKCA